MDSRTKYWNTVLVYYLSSCLPLTISIPTGVLIRGWGVWRTCGLSHNMYFGYLIKNVIPNLGRGKPCLDNKVSSSSWMCRSAVTARNPKQGWCSLLLLLTKRVSKQAEPQGAFGEFAMVFFLVASCDVESMRGKEHVTSAACVSGLLCRVPRRPGPARTKQMKIKISLEISASGT